MCDSVSTNKKYYEITTHTKIELENRRHPKNKNGIQGFPGALDRLEMIRHFAELIGIDFDQRFLGKTMKKQENVEIVMFRDSPD